MTATSPSSSGPNATTTPTLGCGGVYNGAIAIFQGNGNGKLSTPVYYPTTAYGAILPVVADFDSDGKLDVLSTTDNYVSGNAVGRLIFLHGDGDGSFRAPQIMALPFNYPFGIVTADFDGDGKNDLAILTPYSGVQVMFGYGTGKFRQPVSYQVPSSYPQSIVLAQLVPGTRPDLVIGGYSSAAVLLNSGAGKFSVSPSYPLGGWNSSSVAVADFNRDGKQDIVLTSACSETSFLDDHCPDGTISVLLGNGNGTMQATVPASLTVSPQHQVLADMNGDGIPDMVGTSYCNGCSNAPDYVIVALGKGGGTFAPSISYSAIGYISGLAVADMNGDGHPDVIVNGMDSSGSLSQIGVLLGNKDGSLGSPATFPLLQPSYQVPAVGDFSGNGKLGVAVIHNTGNPQTAGQSVGILLGNGNGTLKPEVLTQTSELDPFNLTVGDFNQDGKGDLAVIGGMHSFPGYLGVTVLLGKGNGTFTVKPNPDSNPANNYFSTCNNQNLCVFPASYPSSGLYGQFGEGQVPPITAADINGDSKVDLVIANECKINDPSCSSGNLLWLYGHGDGTFNLGVPGGPQQQLFDANYLGVTVADMNGDGKPDVIASTLSGVAVYLAPFTTTGTIYATSAHSNGAVVPSIGDLNGDGGPDIVIANGQTVELLFNRKGEPVESSPATVSFPAESVGTSAPTQEVTIKNTGSIALGLKSFSISGAGSASYSITGQTCGATLAARSSCTISVKFTPARTGQVLATIFIADNASGSPQKIALSGTGK